MVTTSASPPLDRARVTTALVVVLGSFMTLLDTTIVNVAIPTLSSSFHTGLFTIEWVVTGYLLALSIVMPLCGWLTENWGAANVWIVSVGLFTVASTLCALSWSVTSLIVFRFVQGMAGGTILPIGQTIVAQAAGPERMGRMMSIIGAPTLIAPVLGPVLGGLIVQFASWRLIFLVNVPIGIVAVFAALRVFARAGSRTRVPFDAVGFILLGSGCAALVFGLSRAGAADSFAAWRVVSWLVGGLVLVGLFVAHAVRQPMKALIDVRVFRRSRSFAAASVMSFLFSGSLLGVMLMLSFYYQSARGESPLAAGALIAPQGAGAIIAMFVAGWLTDRYGAGRIVPVAIILCLAGTAVLTQAGSRPALPVLAVALFVRGLGLGSILTPAISAGLATLPRADVPSATTAINIVQRLSGAMGTTLLAVILASGLSRLPQGSDIAGAFDTPFWVAWAMVAGLIVPALFLPRRPIRASRSVQEDEMGALA